MKNRDQSMSRKFHVHLPNGKRVTEHSFVINLQQNQNTALKIYNYTRSTHTKNFGDYFCFH